MTMSGMRGPAPQSTSRKCAGAVRAPSLSRNFNRLGTMLHTVAASFSTSLQNRSERNRSHSTAELPHNQDVRLERTRPLTWWTGSTISTRVCSSHSSTWLIASPSVIRLAAVSSTPFGSPVVPLVYTRSAGASRPTATSAGPERLRAAPPR